MPNPCAISHKCWMVHNRIKKISAPLITQIIKTSFMFDRLISPRHVATSVAQISAILQRPFLICSLLEGLCVALPFILLKYPKQIPQTCRPRSEFCVFTNNIELPCQRNRGRPQRRFMELVVEESLSVGVKKENVRDRMRWREIICCGDPEREEVCSVLALCFASFGYSIPFLPVILSDCVMVSYGSSNIFLQKICQTL